MLSVRMRMRDTINRRREPKKSYADIYGRRTFGVTDPRRHDQGVRKTDIEEGSTRPEEETSSNQHERQKNKSGRHTPQRQRAQNSSSPQPNSPNTTCDLMKHGGRKLVENERSCGAGKRERDEADRERADAPSVLIFRLVGEVRVDVDVEWTHSHLRFRESKGL